jgi:ATP-binding cassette, subfamily B, multidrug efflux pump
MATTDALTKESALEDTMDSNIGKKVYKRTYTGMSIDQDQAVGSDAAVLWRIFKLAAEQRGRLTLAIIGILAAAVFQLMIPQFLGDAVDGAVRLLGSATISAAEAKDALYNAAWLLLGASVLRGIFTLLHNYCGETLGHHLSYRLRLAFYQKLQNLNFSFHDSVHTGELITRGMLDLEGVRSFMNTGPLRVLLLGVLIGFGAYLLLSIDLALGALSLSFVPFVAWRSASARLHLRELWFALQDRMGVLGRIMDENLTGIRVVRAFGAEPYELDKYDVASDQASALAAHRIRVRVSSTTVMNFAFFISMGLVLWMGGQEVIDGKMTVGTLTEFLTFMTILQQPVRQLGMVVNSFARASTCGARLFAVLDLDPPISDAPDAKALEVTDGTLKFEDVTFSYRGEDAPPVLNGVSFEVRRGRTLGIVGPPGSGKSTIAHLLPRYYDIADGRITIDGQDIRDVTLESLRHAVRVVQQDPFLFTSTLENNIAYGDPWADDPAIQDAAATAQIDGFIDQLPEHYKTLVGERGVSLSGGQKQRIAIARTAILRPAVLVLDDSMAAIDAGTEQRIREELRTHTENCATLIVSHRLGALRHADEIIFIEDGRIAERGTHDELISLDGKYAALFALQTRDGSEAAIPDVAGGGA